MSDYKSARSIMEAMNAGKIQRQHLGEKNFYVLKQELFSHKNQYKPNTFTPDESIAWDNKLYGLLEQISKLSESEQNTLYKEVDNMLGPDS